MACLPLNNQQPHPSPVIRGCYTINYIQKVRVESVVIFNSGLLYNNLLAPQYHENKLERSGLVGDTKKNSWNYQIYTLSMIVGKVNRMITWCKT